MSRHDERRNWNSNGARSSAGNREMWRGLFWGAVNTTMPELPGLAGAIHSRVFL